MVRKLNILAPTRYPWRFNGPRHSRHNIVNKDFLPLNYLTSRLEGVTAFSPRPGTRFDMIHAFNRIPLFPHKPFIIGFESHLPRAFGMEDTKYFKWLRQKLASGQCRGIIAISRHAENVFCKQHQHSDEFDILKKS